jgi:dihydrofolate reductase/thymidylate synthase
MVLSLPIVHSDTRLSFVTFVCIRKSESHDLNGRKSIEGDKESDKFEIQNFCFLPKIIFNLPKEYHYILTFMMKL